MKSILLNPWELKIFWRNRTIKKFAIALDDFNGDDVVMNNNYLELRTKHKNGKRYKKNKVFLYEREMSVYWNNLFEWVVFNNRKWFFFWKREYILKLKEFTDIFIDQLENLSRQEIFEKINFRNEYHK